MHRVTKLREPGFQPAPAPSFVVHGSGANIFQLQEQCQQFVDNLRMPMLFTKHEAAHYALDLFKRTVLAELENLEIECRPEGANLL